MKKILFVFAVLIAAPLLVFAQSKEDLYDKEWKKADSLFDRGLPKSAQKVAEDVYNKAKAKNQQVQVLKAQLYLLKIQQQTNEEASAENISKAEQEIRNTDFPLNAVWQSIAAQLYWNYYQQNRGKILDRTTVGGEATVADFEQWDANRFYSKVSSLYKASVSKANELKGIRIEQYDPILVKGVNTRSLRPTLFDLLAFRAISFFEQAETGITKPAYAFTMNDPAAFADAERFMNHKFESKDSLSNEYHALQLYQQVIALHINDVKTDALIDADIQRLAFAYRTSVLSDKRELYRKALERIKTVHDANPQSASAAYQLVLLMLEETSPPIPYSRPGIGRPQPAKPVDYITAKKKLEEIIRKHPESDGGVQAQNLISSITQQILAIQAEEVVLPGEASKILLSYRNLPKVWVRVVPVSIEDFKKGYRYGNEEWNKKLLQIKAIKEWSLDLPGTTDYNEHSTEVMLDALPQGMYAVIVSGDAKFAASNNTIQAALFQVSQLSVLLQSGGSGYVLDRKTGMPVAGANVEVFYERYNSKTNSPMAERAASVSAGKDGAFTLPADNNRGYNALVVKSGKDELYLNEYLNIYRGERGETGKHEQTFFFTDRSIYRPGQTIYYKGIMLRTSDGGKKNEVMANESSDVTLYDVNGQKVAAQTLTTNEFGSFSGSFIAPEGLLNGYMSIGNNSGGIGISVEEYKRPKFAVRFDTLTKDYALNETITVKGKAVAYAGNNIDGAAVSYRVVRQARWPYYWAYSFYGRGFLPSSPEMEITRGTAVTDKDGSFTVNFKTIPDPSIDEKTLPVFTYTIYADVTDLNGETRSGSQGVSAGYVSIQMAVSVPEKGKPTDLDTISIRSENLNGQFVSTGVQVRISKLVSPGKVYRKRLWNMPDQYIIDEATFRRLFPLDEYKDESDPMKWAKGSTVWEKNITTAATGIVAIPANTWKENGWYVLEAEAKDKNGKQVTEKKYVQVWDRNNSGTVPSALIVVPQQQTAEPGDKVRVDVASGYDKAMLIEQVQYMGEKTELNQKTYNGKPLTWGDKTITEEDRGGIALQYIMIKENRVYTEQASVNVPWSNKDLNISWETHRDKLLPGEKETWTMVVRGAKKEKLAAELVATLYDASLDAFRPHQWGIHSLFPTVVSYMNWNTNLGFGIAQGRQIAYVEQPGYRRYEKSYDRLMFMDDMGYRVYRYMDGMKSRSGRGGVAMESLQSADAAAPSAAKREAKVPVNQDKVAFTPPAIAEEENVAAAKPQTDAVPLRSNFNETAFFYPQLKTDADGNIRIQFTMPEALTEWKMMAFAHTKDMSNGLLEGKIKTQKDLMVMPGLPRFLRQGDELEISTKISNLTDKDMNGAATLQILDALTLKPLDLPFRMQGKDVNFTAVKGQSTNAVWKVHVPQSLYNPVIIRITARSGNFTDGEENVLPILTNRMMITETLPLWINGNGSKNFSFDKLRRSDTSKTLSQYNLSVEYTGNPAWYAVQALPYLMEYPYECAEQTFNRYYATALAAHIVEKAPRIKAIFKSWETLDTAALLSNLQKNQELKSALLEETPWVMEAKNESEQKKRIAMLFQATKLAATLDKSARQLEDMLLPEGAFPWFKGMYPDRYITQYIATGIARLQHLGISGGKGHMQRILDRTLPYLDKQIKDDYDLLVKNKAKLDQQHIGHTQVQYLYMRSFMNKNIPANTKTAYDYYTKQAAKHWPSFNPYMKGMAALALNRGSNQQAAKDIITSLRETAIRKEEMGMYWMQRGQSYWWYEAPIEAQSLLIECFTEVAKATTDVDAMRVWLLKQKQTQNWGTTKATADACYALLLNGTEWLTNEPAVTIQLGDKTIRSTEQQSQKGTGYFKVNYAGQDIQPQMGYIKLTVQDNANSTSWGAVYWQYFEDMDKITSAATPLVVKKQLYIQTNSDRGPVLEPITETRALKVGDKVISRIEIIVDRDMEYVHLKDMRSSCFEPVNVISAYKWQGGLGYYESTRDAATNFFFNHLRKGKYVFEYPVFVTNKGNFSNGIATIQCMYAPEFSSHSEGIRIKVQ